MSNRPKWCLITCGCLLTWTARADEPILQQRLSQYGLTTIDEVRYLRLRVKRSATDSEIALYKMGKQVPVADVTAHIRSKKPDTQTQPTANFVISHFDFGAQNRLGGYFDVFYRIADSSPASSGAVTIDDAPERQRALVFNYDHKGPGYVGIWINLFNHHRSPAERYYTDATQYAGLRWRVCGAQLDDLEVKIADAKQVLREDASSLGVLTQYIQHKSAKSCWREVFVPFSRLPKQVNVKTLASIVLMVRQHNTGVIYVRDVALTRDPSSPLPSAKTRQIQRSLKRAMWLWNAAYVWRAEERMHELMSFLKRAQMAEVFMHIPYVIDPNGKTLDLIWPKSQVENFVRQLRRKKIEVHAVVGDPHLARPEKHQEVLQWIEQIAAFNRTTDPSATFSGVRLDVEFYLDPQFQGAQRNTVIDGYSALLQRAQQVAAKNRLRFGLEIPFWLDDEAPKLLDQVLQAADSIGIMSYRTSVYGEDGVISHVETELRKAEALRKSVYLGVETTNLDDEATMAFASKQSPVCPCVVLGARSNSAADTIDISFAEQLSTAIEYAARYQASKVLSVIEQTAVPASKMTFYGSVPAMMHAVTRQTEVELAHRYASMVGFAFHCYPEVQHMWP